MKKIKVYIAVVSTYSGYGNSIDNAYCFTSRKEMLDYAQLERNNMTDIEFFEDEIEINED